MSYVTLGKPCLFSTFDLGQLNMFLSRIIIAFKQMDEKGNLFDLFFFTVQEYEPSQKHLALKKITFICYLWHWAKVTKQQK